MMKPNFVNVTRYLLKRDGYDLHVDFNNAIANGAIGNPKHYDEQNFIRIRINDEDIDFRDTPEFIAFLKRYVEIVL